MGKTHEALMRAEEEYQKKAVATSADSQRTLVPARFEKHLRQPALRWFEEIKSKLEVQYPDESLKTILFTGSSHRAGVSMASNGYASFLANTYGYKVFLIEINLHDTQTQSPDVVDQSDEFSNIFTGYSHLNTAYNQNRNGNLFKGTCSKEALRPNGVFQSIRFDEVLQSMRENFDYVILDAPPVTHYSETLTMCKKFDGVILVLDFGKTRKQVAHKVQQDLENAGANFLGVIINKREYYIPKWIYQRL